MDGRKNPRPAEEAENVARTLCRYGRKANSHRLGMGGRGLYAYVDYLDRLQRAGKTLASIQPYRHFYGDKGGAG